MPISKGLRTNEQIRISPVRLIDENDNQIGILPTDEAIRRAKGVSMDLVEVAPNDRPPVCRIMDYGKWKYRQKKKDQKSKQRHHAQQLKEVRLRPKTEVHDRDVKTKHAREFLAGGDRVQFTMLFRGREMAHQDLGFQRMRQIVEALADVAKVELPPKMAGKKLTMVVAPIKKGGPVPATVKPGAAPVEPGKAESAGVAAPAQIASPPPAPPPVAPGNAAAPTVG